MVAATAKGFRGKVVDLAEYSHCHRTSLGRFLAEGKWDERVLQQRVSVEAQAKVKAISERTTEPLFVIHDDTIAQDEAFVTGTVSH